MSQKPGIVKNLPAKHESSIILTGIGKQGHDASVHNTLVVIFFYQLGPITGMRYYRKVSNHPAICVYGKNRKRTLNI